MSVTRASLSVTSNGCQAGSLTVASIHSVTAQSGASGPDKTPRHKDKDNTTRHRNTDKYTNTDKTPRYINTNTDSVQTRQTRHPEILG